MRMEGVHRLPQPVRDDIVNEMISELHERCRIDHLTNEERAQWWASARAAVEMVCDVLPDFLSDAKVSKYLVMRGKLT